MNDGSNFPKNYMSKTFVGTIGGVEGDVRGPRHFGRGHGGYLVTHIIIRKPGLRR